MSLSRWKMMAGVLGVSIGGLAAAASQCPKLDKTKGRSSEPPMTAEAPKLPPAGASAPATPPPLPVPGPAAPQLAPSGVTPPALPFNDTSKMLPPSGDVPKIPAPTSGPAIPDLTPPAPTELKLPAKPADVIPPAPGLPGLPGVPEPGAKPTTPTAPPATKTVAEAPKPALPAPGGDLLPPPPAKPEMKPTAPVGAPPIDFGPAPGTLTPPAKVAPPVIGASGTMPATNPGTPVASPPNIGTAVPPPPSSTPPSLPIDQPAVIDVPASKPTPAPGAVTQAIAPTKFRILLRVGEGEPTFEVKCGDDLVLKVACEKVDIKSPEKGSGLSSVTAKGKVRFAGFGAEGTCDELSFMAGTGEVSMSGEVKVQVKDKLGRVESELTTASMKYKIDASVVGNALKP